MQSRDYATADGAGGTAGIENLSNAAGKDRRARPRHFASSGFNGLSCYGDGVLTDHLPRIETFRLALQPFAGLPFASDPAATRALLQLALLRQKRKAGSVAAALCLPRQNPERDEHDFSCFAIDADRSR
jgi:hypothetical protein